MKRKIAYILIVLSLSSSLCGCKFVTRHQYEATVVAEEKEHEHENKIEQLDENKSIHKYFVDELNGNGDIVKDHETKSNSEILAEIVEWYNSTPNYAVLFESSGPCGNYTDWFVPGYDNVDEIFFKGSHIIDSINNVYTYNMQSDKLFVAKDSLLNKFCTIIKGETFSGCEEELYVSIRRDGTLFVLCAVNANNLNTTGKLTTETVRDYFKSVYDKKLNNKALSQDEKDFIYEISNYSYDNEDVNMKAVEVFDSPALVIELYNIEPFVSSIEDDMYDYIQEPKGPGIRSDLQQIFCLKDNVYFIGSALKIYPVIKVNSEPALNVKKVLESSVIL